MSRARRAAGRVPAEAPVPDLVQEPGLVPVPEPDSPAVPVPAHSRYLPRPDWYASRWVAALLVIRRTLQREARRRL